MYVRECSKSDLLLAPFQLLADEALEEPLLLRRVVHK